MSESGTECPVQCAVLGHKYKNSSFFSAPGLFVGLNFKVSAESDTVKSPTSPLELRVFSNLSNSVGSPKSSHDGHRRSWDCSKVGLGIVDSLDDDVKISRKALGPSESKNIIFGPQIRTKAPNFQTDSTFPHTSSSVPKNCPIFPRPPSASSEVFFEIGEPLESSPLRKTGPRSLDSRCFAFSCAKNRGFRSTSLCPSSKNVTLNGDMDAWGMGGRSLDSDKTVDGNLIPAFVVPVDGIVGSLSASEIELSEDYTCVISHGVNPKTTHIYGDCILECHSKDLSNFVKNEVYGIASSLSSPYHPSDFLCFCHFCNKELENGKDIYIYRGEKAFCSSNCRYQQIVIDEELEKSVCKTSETSSTSKDGDKLINTDFASAA